MRHIIAASTGPQGLRGLSADIDILRTITSDYGSNAAVLNSGSGSHAALTFVIPCGKPGDPGTRGPTGPQGLIGHRGAMGPTGAAGQRGPTGREGPRGQDGTPGLRGCRGNTGPTGSTGVAGSPGPRGRTGPTGPAGSTGAPGPQGQQGLRGPTGPQGQQGTTGPRGLPGAAGPAGPQGIPGMRGAAGLTGPQGSQGLQGIPGSRGPTGPAGAAGINGLPGPRGITGATGPTGIPGTPGMRGPTGATGIPGATGPQGIQGIQGLPGQMSHVYAGLFNSGACELEVRPDEVIALTFSGTMPLQGCRYDENHSIIVGERGIYEIHFAMHGQGLNCGYLETAVTNDGMILPSSALCTRLEDHTPFHASGTLLAEVKAGAHLHFIAYANGGARFALNKGMNLALEAKKISPAVGSAASLCTTPVI